MPIHTLIMIFCFTQGPKKQTTMLLTTYRWCSGSPMERKTLKEGIEERAANEPKVAFRLRSSFTRSTAVKAPSGCCPAESEMLPPSLTRSQRFALPSHSFVCPLLLCGLEGRLRILWLILHRNWGGTFSSGLTRTHLIGPFPTNWDSFLSTDRYL